MFNCDHASVVAKAILATGRLHGPLKLVALAQALLVVFRVLPLAWLAAQVCLEVAADGCVTAPRHLPTLITLYA